MNFRLLPGVKLNRFLHRTMNRIGSDFHSLTSRTICVTDGLRSPLQQARLLLAKLKSGSELKIYRNRQAADQIRAAYFAVVISEAGEEDTVTTIAEVIESQLSEGIFLSKHLLGSAVDIRSRDLSSREKRLLCEVAKPHVSRIIEEAQPPHFHLEFERSLPKLDCGDSLSDSRIASENFGELGDNQNLLDFRTDVGQHQITAGILSLTIGINQR